ncbi:MAG: SPOR domain-containing protein [Bacteroidota bacterium]
MKLDRTINPVYHRIFFVCLVVGLFTGAEGQDRHGIEVRPGAGVRFESLPGKLLNIGFRVSNTSPSRHTVQPQLVLPPEWRSLVREPAFELAPRQSDVRLSSVSIPSVSAAGEYRVLYVLKDPVSDALLAEASVTVVIVPVRKMEIRAVEAPRFVIAGEEYNSTFVITNKGNVASLVRFAARSSAGFRAAMDFADLRLDARESRSITVRVQTDEEIPEKLLDLLEVSAELDGDSAAIARAGSAVEVIPRLTSRSGDRFFEFPVMAKVRVAGEGARLASQLEITGSSRLTEGRPERLEFSIRTPDIQSKSILGQRDEYRVAFRGVGYELYAGDRSFQLSPLTEFGRYGFGVGGQATWGNLTSGVFINETRFVSPRQRQQGAFVRYHTGPAGTFGLNYLHQNEGGGSDVLSVRALSSPFSRTELDLEYGISRNNGMGDDALSLRLSGSEPWISFDARYIDAGPGYRGYFRDLKLQTVTMGLEPWKNLRLEGHVRNEERNVSRDSAQASAPKDVFYQFSIGYEDRISISYLSGQQKDYLAVEGFSRREDAVQLRGGYSLREVSLIVNAEVGTQQDLLAGSKSPFERYSMFSSIRLSPEMSYNLSLEYSEEKPSFSQEAQRRLSYSLGGWLLLSSGTQLTANYFTSRTVSPFVQTYHLIDVMLEHSFPWGHKVGLRGRHNAFTPVTAEDGTAYMVEYAVPIGIPLTRTQGAGILKGKVVDVETGKGIEDVLIYAGSVVTATDDDGYFSFPSLKPDKYYLFIDQTSIGLNRVATQQLPKEVEVHGGEDINFDIGVTRSGTVTGIVRLFAFAEGVADTGSLRYDDRGGHQGAVLELGNGTEIQRRISDNKGRFVFTNVRPGAWSVKVVDGNLPEYHFVEKEVQHVEIKPGESGDLAFKVLPKRRRIQIIQEGRVIEAVKPAEKESPVRPAAKPAVKESPVRPAAKPAVKESPVRPIAKPAEGGLRVPWAAKQCIVGPYVQGSGFLIHISTWSTESGARAAAREVERLTGRKGTVERLSVNRFRIRLTGFKNREEANRICAQLQSIR